MKSDKIAIKVVGAFQQLFDNSIIPSVYTKNTAKENGIKNAQYTTLVDSRINQPCKRRSDAENRYLSANMMKSVKSRSKENQD
jgi:hypothetical protein